MIERRDLQLIRLAVRRGWLSPEQGEDCLHLKRRLADRYDIEEILRRRAGLDESAIAALRQAAAPLLRRRPRRRSSATLAPGSSARDRARTLVAAPLRPGSIEETDGDTRVDVPAFPRASDHADTVVIPALPRPDSGRGEEVTEPGRRASALSPLESDTLLDTRPLARPRGVSEIEVEWGAPLEWAGFERVPDDAHAGRQVGDYSLERLVARSPTATSYAGVDSRTNVPVTVHLLSLMPDRAGAAWATLRERVEQAKSVSSPHVQPPIEALEDGERAFVVTPVLEGWTLREQLDAGVRFEPDEALRIVADLVLGMAALAERGAVHGDLRPDRVLVEPSGRAVLVGIGLSLCVPPYAAPRALEAEPADLSSDQYGLGVTLLELLDNAEPSADPRLEIARVSAGQPVELHDLLTALLSPDAEARFDTPERLQAAVELALEAVERDARRASGHREQQLRASFSLRFGGLALLALIFCGSLRSVLGALGLLSEAPFVAATSLAGLGAGLLWGALASMATLGLVRRGRLPLPGSSTWMIALTDSAGTVGACCLVVSCLGLPAAHLHRSALALGVLVLASWLYGIVLRWFIAAHRKDRGEGHLLAVLGDARLSRWVAIHSPMASSLGLIAVVRVAFMIYFRAR